MSFHPLNCQCEICKLNCHYSHHESPAHTWFLKLVKENDLTVYHSGMPNTSYNNVLILTTNSFTIPALLARLPMGWS